MAILGFQLVSTLIGVSLLSKLSAHFSFTSIFVFGGLSRYLLPTDKEILEGAGLTKVKSKGKRRDANINGPASSNNHASIALESFHFPRSTPLKLRTAEIRAHDIAILPLYTELVWLVDFSVCALTVLLTNDLVSFLRQKWITASIDPSVDASTGTLFLHSFFAPSTINLSAVWCLFLVWFSVSTLFSVLRVYFGRSDNGGENQNAEWPLLAVAAFSSFVVAMLCLSLDIRFLDLGIAPAYGNLTFLTTPEAAGGSAMSWGMFQTTLALVAAIIGVLFAFPGLQFGRVYTQVVQTSNYTFTRLMCHANFIAPQLTLLLWVVPLVARLPTILLVQGAGGLNSTWLLSFGLVCARFLSLEFIGSLRLLCTGLTVALRIAMTKRHMQAYLDTAQTRLHRLAREPGRITNLEVQRIVASVFHCFNFAALQYIAPAVLIIGVACFYKVSTGIGWLPMGQPSPPLPPTASAPPHSLQQLVEQFAAHDWDTVFTAPWFAALQEMREAFGYLWEGMRCQASHVCRGVLGFLVFWCLVAWQAVATTGMAYYRFLEF